MVSKFENLPEMKPCYAKKYLPKLPAPITVRIKFRKIGSAQYISHLDFQKSIHRIVARAGIPTWYTQGFNPHAKIAFGLPLSVGAQSECEYMDIRIDREISCEKIKEQLNAELTDELRVLDVYLQTTKFCEIKYAAYEIKLKCEGLSKSLAEKAEQLFEVSPLIMKKRSKSGEKEIDIIPFIKSISASYSEDDGIMSMSAILSANDSDYLNPEYLINAMRDRFSLLSGDPTKEWYSITRLRILREDMEDFR